VSAVAVPPVVAAPPAVGGLPVSVKTERLGRRCSTITSMALGTLLMIILICVAAAVAVVGLVFLGRSIFGLYRTVDGVQKQLDAEVRVLLEKQEQAMRRADSITANQEQMQESMTRLKTAVDKLSFLLGQFSEARSRLLNLE